MRVEGVGSMGVEGGAAWGVGQHGGGRVAWGGTTWDEVAWGLGRDRVVVCWGSMRGGGNVQL